jgi:phage-related tail fiber protein
MTKFYAIVTITGAAKIANAVSLGTKLNITHMAVGDGGGTLPTPNASQTKLVNEVRRAALNSLTVDAANSSQIIAEQVIPENEGGFWIREMGLFDGDGTLIAVCNTAETYKPQLQEGSGRTQRLRMIIIISSTDAVTLKVDPSVVLATRQYVDESVITVKQYADNAAGNALGNAKSYTDDEVKKAAKTSSDALQNHIKDENPHSQYLKAASGLAELKEAGKVAAALNNLGILGAALREVGTGKSQIPDMGYFGLSAAAPGYQILPGGLILQWGIAAVPVAGSVNVKYPLSIDVGLAQFATPVDVSSTNNYRVGVATSDKNGITLTSTNTASVTGVMWLSIGKLNQQV